MHIKVARETLLSALDRCDHVTNEKSPLEHHKTLLLETQGLQTLRLYSTNSFLSVDTRAVMIGQEPGAVVVGTKDLMTRIRNMPAGYVELRVDPKTLRVTVRSEVSKRNYTLPGLAADTYPKLMLPPDDAEVFKLPARDLIGWLKKVSFPLRIHGESANNVDRSYLRGVQLISEGPKVTLICIAPSSGYARCYIFGELKQPQDFTVFLPVVCHDSLVALGAADDELIIRKTPSAVFLECAHTMIHAQLPAEQYALENWTQPLPMVTPNVHCQVDADRLSDCVGAVGVAAVGVTACLQMMLRAGTLTVRVVESDHDGEDALEVAGDGVFSVHFDPAILQPALKSAGTETLGLTHEDAWNALILRGEKFLAFTSIMNAPRAAPPKEEEKPKGRGKRKGAAAEGAEK